MKSPCPRLWKQIGSQTHQKEQMTSIVQIKSTNQPQILKYENQQINIALEESSINVQLSDLELEENEKDCIQELKLFRLGRKLTATSDVLGRILSELPPIKQQNVSTQNDMQKNKSASAARIQQKLLNACNILKNTTNQLQTELTSFKFNIESMFGKICADLNREVIQVQGMYQHHFSTISKSYISKCLQFDDLHKLYQEKQQKQKQLQLALAINDKQIKCLRAETHKLMRQVDLANLEKISKFKENTELSQKVFDLEQKLLSFDLRVQESVQLVLNKINSLAPQENFHFSDNREEIQNNYFNNSRSPLKDKQCSSSRKPIYTEATPYEPKFVQSKFSSPKRRESFGQQEKEKYQEKHTAKNQFTAKKSLQRLFQKAMYQSQPMGSFKSPTRHASNSDFFNREHNYTERLKTTSSKQQQFGHTSSGFSKKYIHHNGSKMEPKVDNISQKLNKIRAKIESQIKNITIYKQKK